MTKPSYAKKFKTKSRLERQFGAPLEGLLSEEVEGEWTRVALASAPEHATVVLTATIHALYRFSGEGTAYATKDRDDVPSYSVLEPKAVLAWPLCHNERWLDVWPMGFGWLDVYFVRDELGSIISTMGAKPKKRK